MFRQLKESISLHGGVTSVTSNFDLNAFCLQRACFADSF